MEILIKNNPFNEIIIGKLAYRIRFSVSGKISDFATGNGKERIIDGTNIERQYGGMAGNIAYGLSILGGKSLIISQVGKDFDHYYRPHLEKLGVSLNVFTDPEKESACWYEIQDEENTKLVIKQNNSYHLFAEKTLGEFLDTKDIDLVKAVFIGTGKAEADIKFISDMLKRNNRIPLIYSPDSNIVELTKWRLSSIFDQITILLCTEEELNIIERKMKSTRNELIINSKRMKYIISMYERSKIVVYSEKTKIKVSEGPAEEVLSDDYWKDAFRAGLIFGVSSRKPVEEAARLGSALASYAVETRECQTYSPSIEQVTLRSFEVKTIEKGN